MRDQHDLLAGALGLVVSGVWQKAWHALLDELGLSDRVCKSMEGLATTKGVFSSREGPLGHQGDNP